VKLHAYEVSDRGVPAGIVFAGSQLGGLLRGAAAFNEGEPEGMEAKAAPWADEYGAAERVPASVTAAQSEHWSQLRIERQEEVTRTRQDIEAATDEAVLSARFIANTDVIDDINDRLRAHREGMGRELVDEGMMRRACDKVAALSRDNRWIERRMITLGFIVPHPPTDPRAREIRHLHEKVGHLKRALRRHGFDDRGEKIAA
jgi:hypothetical protein